MNNAGVASDHSDTSALETVTLGAIRVCQAFVPAMKEAGRGVILNVSSQAALSAVTRLLADELAPWNIRVNSVKRSPADVDPAVAARDRRSRVVGERRRWGRLTTSRAGCHISRMNSRILPALILLNAFAATSAFAQSPSLSGEWAVDSTGHECVTTGWLENEYEPKFGKIVGTRVKFTSDQVAWGKSKFSSVKYETEEDELEFFDGSACSESAGALPSGCASLMDQKRGKTLETVRTRYKQSGDPRFPTEFTLLSKDRILAVEGGTLICLKRLP